ncbi:L,D-transpeptidase family protein [Marinobacter salinexigens]|uniref:L,D-transpeptidase family protein n=1 Tax=Marinobacter salinexigens TaxID=2919747 RepID=A0A5B0VJX7_9GAMM|nr:L,D-transpeptidase family protein [Marinobacter salinexigens]KAA1174241.1 L,D-transpeptidase family protein [Marinobacter salinexigens]
MRFLVTGWLISLFLLLPISGTAAEKLLAKADLQMPTIEALQPKSPFISRVVVRKSERRLDLMNGERVIRSYRISLGDNPKGHKLYEGDERTPEGDYTLDWRNADSDFYKSIHISYPSERDRELASAWGLDPGGSIMIHGLPNNAGDMAFAYQGLDWTNGCIAVNNDEIDEIWQLVDDGTPIRILP